MDEIVRVIDVNDDFGEDDKELKDAIIGKTSSSNNQNVANPFIKPTIETL